MTAIETGKVRGPCMQFQNLRSSDRVKDNLRYMGSSRPVWITQKGKEGEREKEKGREGGRVGERKGRKEGKKGESDRREGRK